MITRIKRLFRQAPLLVSAFALALCLMLWFGGQTVMHAIYWSDPRHQNQAIQPWMTIGYVGQSWRVPREDLRHALDDILPDDLQGRLPPIRKLARETGLSEAEIISRLEAAIAVAQASVPDGQ